MSDEKGYRKMAELVAALGTAEVGLRTGELGLEGLDTACTDARELYERLVVLRHKARENALRPGKAGETKEATPRDPEPIRLDTRPTENPMRQTSLIEEIEATEQQHAEQRPVETEVAPKTTGKASSAKRESTAPRPKADKTPATLAEKLENASIPDLAKAISLSHKFWFVAELFNGDRSGYDKALAHLNGAVDGESAKTWFDTEVVGKLKKPADPEALATFTELLKRRFA